MRIGLIGLFCCGLGVPVMADPLHDGTNAFAKEDYKTAMALLAPLATQGDGRAECMVTVMRDIASGKSASYSVESMAWDCMAATHGKPWQQLELGDHFADGFIMKQDDTMAEQLIRLAADQGLPRAQLRLGDLYARGRGVTTDLTAACRWWGRAAKQGSERAAQRQFGTCYLTGTGVPQDDMQALLWWGIAKRTGNGPGAAWNDLMKRLEVDEPPDELWETVVRRVSPGRLAELQHMIRTWKPEPE